MFYIFIYALKFNRWKIFLFLIVYTSQNINIQNVFINNIWL